MEAIVMETLTRIERRLTLLEEKVGEMVPPRDLVKLIRETLIAGMQPAAPAILPQNIQPKVLTKPLAAKALCMGRTKLDAMIKRGEIETCDVGGKTCIRMEEIDRITRTPGPGPELPRTSGRRRGSSSAPMLTPTQRAESIREQLRAKRKKPKADA